MIQLISCSTPETQEEATTASEQPLFAYSGERPVNLLMISIDTWRYDQLDPQLFEDEKILLAPTINVFEEEGVSLKKHY